LLARGHFLIVKVWNAVQKLAANLQATPFMHVPKDPRYITAFGRQAILQERASLKAFGWDVA
jgi:hypothetical protein